MNFIKKYFEDKTIPFYVGLGVSLISIITAIVYSATLGHLKEYVTVAVTLLLVFGPIIYIGLSFVKLQKLGMFIMTGLDFAALITYICTIYKYPITKVMDTNILELAELPAIITVAALAIIVCIAGNVLCWLNLKKTAKTELNEGESK